MRAHLLSGLVLAFAALGSSIGCAGGGGASPKAERAERAERVQSPAPRRPLLLWKLQRGAAAPSYLFGTCHMGVALHEALPAEAQRTFDTSRTLVLETDVTDPSLPSLLLEAAALPDGESLRTRLTQAEWRALVERVGRTIPASVLERSQPWYVMLLLLASGGAGATAPEGMDVTLLHRGRQTQKDVRYLESPEEHVALLASIEGAAALGFIRETLEAPEATSEALTAVLDTCRTGDSSFLESVERDEASRTVWELLIRRRNGAWMTPLEEIFADGGAFVAVGAAHLYGDEGLLQLLSERGFELEQITVAGPTAGRESAERSGAAGEAPPGPTAMP